MRQLHEPRKRQKAPLRSAPHGRCYCSSSSSSSSSSSLLGGMPTGSSIFCRKSYLRTRGTRHAAACGMGGGACARAACSARPCVRAGRPRACMHACCWGCPAAHACGAQARARRGLHPLHAANRLVLHRGEVREHGVVADVAGIAVPVDVLGPVELVQVGVARAHVLGHEVLILRVDVGAVAERGHGGRRGGRGGPFWD